MPEYNSKTAINHIKMEIYIATRKIVKLSNIFPKYLKKKT